ncbi:MAG: PAS domain S-box protein [Pirellulaceae bacterium]
MNDQAMTREQLIEALAEMRRQVAGLEKSLQENHSAASILQVAPLGIHELDTEGRITFVNPSQEAITGFTAHELMGTYIWDRVEPGPDRDSLPAYLEHLVSEQPTPAPYFAKNIRKNGEVFDVRVDWNYKRNPQGQVIGFVCIVCDITEHTRAEAALRESEERFRQAMEATNDGLWDWNVKSGHVYYSPAYSRMLGYEATEFAERTESWTDLLHPHDRAKAVRVNQDCIENRIPHFEVEFRMRTKSGEWKTILGRGKALYRDADGRPIRMIGTHVDITARKRTEEELAKSKTMLQAAIDCLPFNFFAIGLDGRYMLQNAVSKAQLRVDAIGKLPEEVCPNKRDLAIYLDNNRRAFAGEKVEEEVTLSLGGEERSYYNIVAPIRDGKELHGILGVNIDVTEVKRAEVALRKAHDELEQRVKEIRLNEARLEAVLHLSHMMGASQKEITEFAMEQAVALTESKIGYVAFMNEDETVLTMHSWSKEAMAECAMSDKPLVYPVVSTGLWGEAARQRKPIVTNDYPAPNPWKKGIPEGHVGLRCHMNVPIIDEGHIVIVAGVGNKDADYNESDVRQLTLLMTGMWTLIKRNRMQAELRQHQDHLEQLVHERTESLWRMLQASDHERQIISYDIHDGLAQYLAAAGMQFRAHDFLQENSPDKAKRAYKIAVGLVRQAHAESRRLINEVRPPIIDETGLETAISHLVHEHRRHGGPKIKFDSDVQFKRLPSILENALYRIAQEALTNACKHSKSKKVKVTLAQNGQDVRLKVRDWGIGFDPDSIKAGHFGVGAIRQRVRLLGGRLTIESKPGFGTLIRAIVPILEQPTED